MNDARSPRSELPVMSGSIYDWPRYYDFVYGSDWQAECDFLNGCFRRFANLDQGAGSPVQRLFEPACGTGRLLYRLGRQGYQVSGVDLNEPAVEFCNRRLVKAGIDGAARVADMCDFRLEQPCDAAFNTISSFRHLENDQRARDHLKCMASALRPGGLYVLGFHLTPESVLDQDDSESWSHRRGHLQVNTSMWLLDRDVKQRQERFAVVLDVYTPTRQFRIEDEISFRMYTAHQFMELLNQVPEFAIAGVFDFSYDLDCPVRMDESSEDTVFVLRKQTGNATDRT